MSLTCFTNLDKKKKNEKVVGFSWVTVMSGSISSRVLEMLLKNANKINAWTSPKRVLLYIWEFFFFDCSVFIP